MEVHVSVTSYTELGSSQHDLVLTHHDPSVISDQELLESLLLDLGIEPSLDDDDFGAWFHDDADFYRLGSLEEIFEEQATEPAETPAPPPDMDAVCPVFSGATGTCSVCMDGTAGEPCRRLACGHTFHANCIDAWVRHKANCPICREGVGELASGSGDAPASGGGDAPASGGGGAPSV